MKFFKSLFHKVQVGDIYVFDNDIGDPLVEVLDIRKKYVKYRFIFTYDTHNHYSSSASSIRLSTFKLLYTKRYTAPKLGLVNDSIMVMRVKDRTISYFVFNLKEIVTIDKLNFIRKYNES